MTTGAALVLSLSLFIHNFTLWCGSDFSFLRDGHMAATFVFLFSICLLISQIDFLPRELAKKHPLIHCLLEVPISLILIEWSLYFFWGGIQEFIYRNADEILLFLSEDLGLEWLVCHLCCGNSNCTDKLIGIWMTFVSFDVLMISCILSYFI